MNLTSFYNSVVLQLLLLATYSYVKGDLSSLYDKDITSDFVYSKSTGEIFPPGKASWDAAVETYRLFTNYHHEPYFVVCWELDDGSGWEATGKAWLFANLPGEGNAAKPHTDRTGKQWEVKVGHVSS